ncbi:hypothetical protein BV20DRAFT_934933 [Pilatotrama ljubarskyi]|nr:hypothetical protein BV20DRAFT_934933 [Pilatotrama ljubarskyi]
MSPAKNQQERGVKRKKPPTFQHLPAERAKKLKRSWVEVQKIKSKWKAQKRKEGLAAPRSQLEHMVDAGEDEVDEPDDAQDEDAASHSSSEGSASEESEESGDEVSEEESPDEAPPPTKSSAKRPPPRGSKPQKGGSPEKMGEKPTLRELQKMAYSKSSLHTNKSHPLNRHKGPAASRGRGGGRGGGTRGSPRGRGRGQPDMGLRMKAMLEKIKQDFT